MADILIRAESVELLARYEDWVQRAGHTPRLTTSLAAAHSLLFQCQRAGRMPAAVVTTQPPGQQAREIPRWEWLDALRVSAAPARLLLLVRHPLVDQSPRPNSVVLSDPALSEAEFRESLGRVLRGWPQRGDPDPT